MRRPAPPQVAFFQRPDVRAFADAVARTHFIYTRRWGDAPLRHFAVHAFLGGDAPRRLLHLCWLPYTHARVPCWPVCRSPGGNETVLSATQNDCVLGGPAADTLAAAAG